MTSFWTTAYAGNAFALMRRAERFLIDWMPVAGKIVPGQMARIDTPALPWNPWIAKVFYRRGLIETWGRGTLKIATLMQEAGLAAPTLRVHNDFVTMTFALPDSLVRIKKGGALEETPVSGSEKSSEKILRLLRAEPKLSASALAAKLGVSSRAVEKQIALLKKEGSLFRNGPAKGGHWQVIE